MLYRFRGGDANMRSVWICARNDAIGNLAVYLPRPGYSEGGQGGLISSWPPLWPRSRWGRMSMRCPSSASDGFGLFL
jgi:hypothetical protein